MRLNTTRATSLALFCLLIYITLPTQVQGAAPAASSSCSYQPPEVQQKQSMVDMSPQIKQADKTLYIVPHGGLEQRLLATGSGLTLAKDRGYNAVVVWRTFEDFPAAWLDLFQGPELPLGLLPGGNTSPACTLYEVDSHEDFHAVHRNWEEIDGQKVLCIASSGSIIKNGSFNLKWFYKMLLPSDSIMRVIKEFQDYQYWNKWGQWIGVHICYSPTCAAQAGSATQLPSIESYLSMAKSIKDLPVDGETVPRFYVVSEDYGKKVGMQAELWAWNMTGLKGAAISYPDQFLPFRTLKPIEEQILNLYLLSSTNLIIGTQGSAFSDAAHAMGKAFYLAVGK